MSLTYKQLISPLNIRIDGCGNCSFNEEFHQTALLKPETEYNIQMRFSLPTTTQASYGSKLLSVSFIYKIISGSLSEIIPSISKYVYRNNVLSNSSAIQINYPDLEGSEVFKYNPEVSVCKGTVFVDSPVFENNPFNSGVSWLYSLFVTAASNTSLIIYGAEITYEDCFEIAKVSDVVRKTSFELFHTSSGLNIPIDTSERAVTVTLPPASSDNVGVTYKLKIVNGGNSFRIQPASNDYIVGVGLNPSLLLAGKFMLLNPIKDNFIKICTFSPGVWRVLSAAGDWSLDNV